MAFASNRDGNWEIYTMNGDGTDVRRLTARDEDDRVPAWAPDGKTLAAGSDDRRIIVLDVATRRRIGQPLQGHTDFL